MLEYPNITQLLKSVPVLTVSVPEQCNMWVFMYKMFSITS